MMRPLKCRWCGQLIRMVTMGQWRHVTDDGDRVTCILPDTFLPGTNAEPAPDWHSRYVAEFLPKESE